MIKIEDLELAVALARAPSLSAAARSLDVTPPAVSMRLRKLEKALGLALAVRTARRLRLTSEGERFAHEAETLLDQLHGLSDSFQRDDRQLAGTLRIAAPFGFGRKRLAPLLADFARQHPTLKIHLDLSETPWPARADIDAVVHIGSVRDSSWISRSLASNARWLCASPAYLKLHGAPRTKQDIQAHACIGIRENNEDTHLWPVRMPVTEGSTKLGRMESLKVSPSLTTNDGSVAMLWAEQGLGLVLRSEWDAQEAVRRRALVRLVPDWQFSSAPVTLLVPTRIGRTARVQAMVAFLGAAFKQKA
jgi:DNA-binding transcriptional LysR family regulator